MTITLYTADWLLPVSSSPIRDGAIAVKGDRIHAVGKRADLLLQLGAEIYTTVALGARAILPGLVNIHSHLELTIMRGLLEGLSFRNWILELVNAKAKLNADHFRFSAIAGACEAARAGITTLADTGATGAA